MSGFEQERGEAVAWAHVATMNGVDFVQYPLYLTEQDAKWSIGNYAEGSKVRIEPLTYLHPTLDAGRVAEMDDDEDTYQLGKRDGYEEAVQDVDAMTGGDGEYIYAIGDSDRHCPDAASMKQRIADRFAALESQLAESREQIACRDNDLVLRDKALDASRAREGMMREALAERLKNAEQAAFEAWFYKECPSGDAAAVQDKWLESDARTDALDGWATAEAALAAEKEGE